MKESDYKLWLEYHYGRINRKLTKNEYSEIIACEFAMHLLIPTDKLLEICGGLNNLKDINIYNDYSIINWLANVFSVPEEVMLFKIDSLIKEENIDRNKINKKK